ncbi:SseB family protein [Streptomyces sp. NBC_01363]|uniref:SseB family protein n=1 Tax=Streptomyces sp. NBC_01363 TaxID=2903840 RepID=UPI0022531EFA|nr:SseB family protein [Streptomyces sp. NBC_01363]MCX4734898.1 SseB family protein [Streptomyces sp. NBC_01363]
MTTGGDTASKQRPLRLADLAGPVTPPVPEAPEVSTSWPGIADDPLVAARREFAVLLGEFRRTAVLVPFDASGSLWSAERNGVRWICAFSDEGALARFAYAQGDAGREWTYRAILGARLLDVMVPLLPGPAGVALDAGSEDGVLFPPVAGVVPEAVAMDLGESA